ncbi:MAG: hypothetical protein IJQ34_09010, partial [Kiritimatiellae bacterium]|nr:hypothetical protein [Kiritimatiellia bacterium]
AIYQRPTSFSSSPSQAHLTPIGANGRILYHFLPPTVKGVFFIFENFLIWFFSFKKSRLDEWGSKRNISSIGSRE